MQRMISAMLVLVCLASIAVAADPVQLFNGHCLHGWKCHNVEDKAIGEVWKVEKGILETTGQPFGYLHTTKSYQDFKLTVEWRWVPDTEPTNCGVLMRMNEKPISFLTKCVEAQLKHGSVGDLWGFYGACFAEERYRSFEHKLLGKMSGVSKSKDVEKKPGEWNTYVITLKGEKITIELNGEKVNEASGLEVKAGPIGLQSEGGPIQFRKVELARVVDET